ncbi:MAG TPA: efflux RND transporter permease subunit [Gemmataceae bacterium]|nr:efflux RND transporter permease subunit [Gemmataceae bacterium]
MLARIFIDRPVLAWVISIIIFLLGILAAALLPIAQYPQITPPTITVSCQYPGANAEVVATTVAAPIEQQVNGVEGMLYMSSQSNNDGSYALTITFAVGSDLNMSQVLVQNRVAQALPQLPQEVQAIGVVVKKRTPDLLLVINLYSDTDPATNKPYYDQLYLSNYATIHLQDALARVEGVGDVLFFGQQNYSMRVWVDPDELASRDLTSGDVVKVLREQNVQVAAGQIGQQPAPPSVQFQYTMTTLGRLETPEQFGNIILATGQNGEITYLKDVARIEMGAQNLDQRCTLDGQPSVGVVAFQLPQTNALDVASNVRNKMRELQAGFPPGLKYAIVLDTTPFIRESVAEVRRTLIIAILLVALVVLLFLQDWRSLLLPVIDVGVSLVGTFAVMALIGFSLNNLTLFGLVLAIGIVVDDAIVVLENIERWLDKGLPVRDATIHAMNEITGPVLAITLVLSSVFLPSAFLTGITGQFFRQFALTISVAMIISAVNAMTMTPARAASIFANRRPGAHGQQGKEPLPWWGFGIIGGLLSVWILESLLGTKLGISGESEQAQATGFLAALRTYAIYTILFIPGAVAGGIVGWFIIGPVNWALNIFFRGFNWVFDRVTKAYGRVAAWALRLSIVVIILYLGLIVLTGFGFTRIPSGFIPPQDQGRLYVNIQLPDAASLDRTQAVANHVEQIARETPGIAHTIGNPGRSFVLNSISSNSASVFVMLEPFEQRSGDPAKSANAISAQLRRRFATEILDARVNVFGVPAVQGLGTAGGFKLMIESTGEVNYLNLQKQADNLAAKGNQEPGLVGLFNGFRAQTPQYYIDIDRVKAKAMNVALTDIFSTLQVYMGGYYVNDFNRFGRTWQVNVQAESRFRISRKTVAQMKVRNGDGAMVPLGSVLTIRDAVGPVSITRYNMFPSAAVNGEPAPGESTGTAMNTMEQLGAENLPRDMRTEWTELSYFQKQSTRIRSFADLRQNPFSAYVLGVILVFFVLAGLYESWSLPLSVILVVPMCLSSALVGVALAHMDVNIFVQVGFVVLVGLAAKNAILIVQFARDRQREGVSAFNAALEASTVRFRPILMTSFAFILGVVPLVIATGAGAEMRQTLGTAVFSGMIGVTLFGLFLTPVFYYGVRRLVGSREPPPPMTPQPRQGEPGERRVAPDHDGHRHGQR